MEKGHPRAAESGLGDGAKGGACQAPRLRATGRGQEK